MADILVNKSNRAVLIDGILFIPSKPIPVKDAEALKKKFPRVKAMIEAGEIAVVTPQEAAKTSLEEKPMDELKEIAKSENINVDGLTEKADVVAVLKEESKGGKGGKGGKRN